MSNNTVSKSSWRAWAVCLSTLLFGLMTVTSVSAQPRTASSQRAVTMDRIAVFVQKDIVMQSQVTQRMKKMRQELHAMHQPIPASAALRKQAVNQLINQALILQLAKQNNMSITPSELNKAVLGIAKRNGLSIAAFKQQLKTRGMNDNDFRANIKMQMLMARVQQRAVGSVQVSDQAVTQFMQTQASKGPRLYRIQDILLPLADAPSSAQLQKTEAEAAGLRQKVLKAQGVAKVTLPSDATVTDLGWRSLPQVPDLFTSAVKQLRVGQVSAVIRAPNGLHVLYVQGRKRATQKVSRQQARAWLTQQQYEKQAQAWLAQLRQNTYVKIVS
jgi:peptidyl-prolyl cis-trans isomerase SurA